MYALFLILSVLVVVSGFTVGAGLLLLDLIAPWMPRRSALGRVRGTRGRMFAAGLVVVLLTAAVFVAVDFVVPDFPGPRTNGVWASTKTPSASSPQNLSRLRNPTKKRPQRS